MSDELTAEQTLAIDSVIAAIRRYIDDDGDDALRTLYRALVSVEKAHGARSIHSAMLGRELQRQGIISKL